MGNDGTASSALLVISLSPVPYLSPLARPPRSSFHSFYLSQLKGKRGLFGGESSRFPVARGEGRHPVERYFCAVCDYTGKADLILWPKKKIRGDHAFSGDFYASI